MSQQALGRGQGQRGRTIEATSVTLVCGCAVAIPRRSEIFWIAGMSMFWRPPFDGAERKVLSESVHR
jgi:hypothetical protein